MHHFSAVQLAFPEALEMRPVQAQVLDLHRKKPMQARSDATVRAIYEATARIVEREGPDKLTTNRIAEVAGFSIGTLYQYFRNKEGVLLSMAMHERDRTLAGLRDIFSNAQRQPLERTVRDAVRVMVGAFAHRHPVRRVLFGLAMRQGLLPALYLEVNRVAEYLGDQLSMLALHSPQPLSDTARFVVTRGVIGVLRAAVLEAPALMGTAELEDELVEVVLGVLRRGQPT